MFATLENVGCIIEVTAKYAQLTMSEEENKKIEETAEQINESVENTASSGSKEDTKVEETEKTGEGSVGGVKEEETTEKKREHEGGEKKRKKRRTHYDDEPPKEEAKSEDEEEDDNDADGDAEAYEENAEEEEEDLLEIDESNIITGGRRTRGKVIDFQKAAEENDIPEDEEDDGEFEIKEDEEVKDGEAKTEA